MNFLKTLHSKTTESAKEKENEKVSGAIKGRTKGAV